MRKIELDQNWIGYDEYMLGMLGARCGCWLRKGLDGTKQDMGGADGRMMDG